MTGFKQDDDITPVVFRRSRRKEPEVTAVFPCEPADYDGYQMTCYAHVGQHGGCGQGWYNETRAAKPEEYAALKRELESAPYGYRFKVYARIQPWMRDKRFAEARRLSEPRAAELCKQRQAFDPITGKPACHANGAPMFDKSGMMLDDQGNRSIFDDVDE